MTGLALPLFELPDALHPQLTARIHTRGEWPEVQFHAWHRPCLLPVQRNGRIELLPWRGWRPAGDRDTRGDVVVIPARYGFQAGLWFQVTQGVQGLLAYTRDGPVVYMLMTPATNYYRNMTEQSPTMPVFINQVI